MIIKRITIFFISLFPLNALAQITFEKGFFIDNHDTKVECLIKNMDWKNNPNHFEYKLFQEGESKTINISSIKEFGIDNFSKYVSRVVKIDRSSDEYDSLSYERKPGWSAERLLLKVLVEGKASLYFYQNGNLVRFFYSVNESSVQQLVYKKYFIESTSVGVNSDFRQQLWMEVRCGQVSRNPVRNISYAGNDLVRYFNKYNECIGGSSVSFSSRKSGHFLNLRIKPGFDITSYYSYIQLPSTFQRLDFDTKINFRFGLETEFILPSNKNKWAIVFEPTFQYFVATSSSISPLGILSISYHSIEIPMGARHYFFLSETTKIFLNGFLVYDFPLNTQIAFDSGFPLASENNVSFALGGGWSYRKITAELRYYTPRKIVNWSAFPSDYHKLSFILGYKIF